MPDLTISPLLVSASGPSGLLVVESGSLEGQQFLLPPAPSSLLLGRERICNVRFDPERDRVVGRTHARVEVRSDGIYLVDLSSANGTFRANGAAVRGEVLLRPGDRFQLGGEGGPWVSLRGAMVPVAVHASPPSSELATRIVRSGPSLAPPPLASPPLPSPMQPAQPRAPLGPPPPAVEPVQSPDSVSTGAAPWPAIERPAQQDSVAEDSLARQQQRQYYRQIVVIVLLLAIACAAGLALGLREGVSERGEEPTRNE